MSYDALFKVKSVVVAVLAKDDTGSTNQQDQQERMVTTCAEMRLMSFLVLGTKCEPGTPSFGKRKKGDLGDEGCRIFLLGRTNFGLYSR
jgi:hypothetical protein